MKQHLIIVCAMLVVFAGCAKQPDAVVPTNIPISAYVSDNCRAPGQELAKERATLSALSQSQNNVANGDAFGVFLVGLPASSLLGGNKEGDIAVAKGKMNVIELAMKQKRCR